ncbi:MAG: MFS transporter, partial [Candidatus Hydrogenedens sp.]
MSQEIKPTKLFVGSCVALIATAMTFAVLSAIMNPLKQQFLLTNEQVGLIGGAGLWGFPISILIFGPLCSVLGIRFLLRLAFVFFVSGISLMIFATGFWMLFFGALTIAFANGLVEGACNPLVATLYPDRKTEKLNQFHVWFPGGIVIGGLLCYFLDKVG